MSEARLRARIAQKLDLDQYGDENAAQSAPRSAASRYSRPPGCGCDYETENESRKRRTSDGHLADRMELEELLPELVLHAPE